MCVYVFFAVLEGLSGAALLFSDMRRHAYITPHAAANRPVSLSTVGGTSPHGDVAAGTTSDRDGHGPDLCRRRAGKPRQPEGRQEQRQGPSSLAGHGDGRGVSAAPSRKRYRGVRDFGEVPPSEESQEEQEVGPVRERGGATSERCVGESSQHYILGTRYRLAVCLVFDYCKSAFLPGRKGLF